MRQSLLALLLCSLPLASLCAAGADRLPPATQGTLLVPDAARPGPQFDVERATAAYLAALPPERRARSDAYFEGGYGLDLLDALVGVAIGAVLLFSGLSTRIRDRVERLTARPALQALAYGGAYVVLDTVLTLPTALYRDYVREHAYGLSNLSLAGWLGEWATMLAVNAVLGAVFISLAYAVIRRVDRWWQPVALVTVGFLLFVELIVPVYVSPLFNHFQALPAGPVRDSLLSLARANGVSARDIYWFDASRQTTRLSANVSGLGQTLRISINDNLLRDGSLAEIRAVTGHELGHYVLNHTITGPIELGLLLAVIYATIQWLATRLVDRYGTRLGLRDVRDLAALPLLATFLALGLYLCTPVLNTIVRTQEMEADRFGLNAAQEPHGFANAALHLSAYRKMEPTPLEEWVFYDHPSGRTRIHASMAWFAEHQDAGAAGTRAAAP